ncbi:hypothetical protein AB4455_19465 [Vibrio sp. 10N.261.46.E12]|uniref:hypothetical protein n=1 Tax=unclassified Vibrio TaxID=2614977 RepID=UPI000975FC56|nr:MULTISPECIES: hypothetical protein [unclassified Vibrio]OMO33830.1 hypothetical protein BH584_00560 [Vibrio sp. 10N.261.45.E1]PMJ19328.1 hypothetical protein BCU27_21625 [Vibrio sp. 10N.286.45.B6]PML97981.1 hypothetical protein BCT66_20655 [Vibrio sp. 10N.261.49.E11]PMM83135.1 hypothetical protein BCT46_02350 [Vibrio sp. 10N.261.46.E8]PMN59083.1 hypothetical protein BCT32_22330 [Vibrio sp. 10N.261.45.E11]
MKQPGFRSKFNEVKKVRKPAPRNIPVLIERYNTDSDDPNEHFVEGIDLQRDKSIRVFLKELKEPLNSGNTRPHIADYANTDTNMHVNAAGEGLKPGVILFDSCEFSSKDTYRASWMHSMIHDSAKTKETIEIGLSTVILSPARYDENEPDKELFNTAFIRQSITQEAQAIPSNKPQDLLNAVKSAMIQPDNMGKYRPEALVRIVDFTEEEPFVETIMLTAPYKPSNDDVPNELYTADECVEIFLSKAQDENGNDITRNNFALFQSIIESMNESDGYSMDELFIEVIPVQRRNFGPETKKDFFALKEVQSTNGTKVVNALTPKGETMLNRYLRRIPEQDTERLWVPTIIGLAKPNADNSQPNEYIDYSFVTKTNTSDVFPRGYGQSHIPTENYSNEDELKRVFEYKQDAKKHQSLEKAADNSNTAQTQAAPNQTQEAPTQTQVQDNQQEQAPQKPAKTKTNATKKAPEPKPTTSKPAAALRSQKVETTKAEQNTVLDESHEDALFGSLEDALNGTEQNIAPEVAMPESINDTPDYQEPSMADLAEIHSQEAEAEFLDDELFGNMEDALNNATPEYTGPTMS